FSLASKVDASIPEVNSVFKLRDGAIWQFVDQNLTKVLTKQGPQYVPVPGSGVNINPTFLAWINRAAAFSEAAYSEGTQDPRLKYTVKPQPSVDIDQTTLAIDNMTGTFPGDGGQAKQYVWPGIPGNLELNVKFKSGLVYRVNTYAGVWSVFHFVDLADEHRGNVVTAALSAGQLKQPTIDVASGHPVLVKLEMNATPPVFDKGYFATLGCVSTVTSK